MTNYQNLCKFFQEYYRAKGFFKYFNSTFDKASFIQHIRKMFGKTEISCAYQGVRNYKFFEIFYVLTK